MPRRMPEQSELVIFRIVQEVINNTMRHSMAWKVHVNVKWGDAHLEISIEDDGIGNKDRRDLHRSGRGQKGIQQRALFIGARVVTVPAKEKGTIVTITLPFSS